jgi:molecular chaperone Hsp33
MEELEDVLVRGTAWDGKIRVFAARTTQLVEDHRQRHGTYPTATAALGRTLTAGVIMGAMLKAMRSL